MSAGRNLEAVKEKLSEQFLQREPDAGVAGVGIGQDDAGQPVLVVHLDGRNPEARSRVQSQAEGLPVQFVEQGPIRKQPAQAPAPPSAQAGAARARRPQSGQ